LLESRTKVYRYDEATFGIIKNVSRFQLKKQKPPDY